MRLRSRHAWALFAVWLASGLYLYLRADRGWIPHDEGTLAHAAERVLAGELPHRDFDEPYSGGLALLHAAAFELFGVRLVALRWMLLAASLLFVPAVYRIAARVTTPLGAALVTAACVALSLPNYFAPLPSWYNLFCATLGTLALLRHVETDRRRWLFVAGLCGGASFAFKSVGLYYVAAALLFLVYREQATAPPAEEGRGSRAFRLFVGAALVAFDGALLALVHSNPRPMELVHFALPGIVLSAVLVVNEWSQDRGGDRWRRLARLLAPFAAGVALPVGLLCLPYVVTGSLPDLVRGLFVLPRRRLAEAVYSLPAAPTLLYALPLALLFAAGCLRRARLRVAVGVPALAIGLVGLAWARLPAGAVEPPFVLGAPQAAAVALLALLVPLGLAAGWRERRFLVVPAALALAAIACVAGRKGVYGPVFSTLRPLVPLVTLSACALLVLPGSARKLSAVRRQELLLLTAMAALVSLVQFPYAFGVYVCYATPLVVLAALYTVAAGPRGIRPVHACVLVFYAAFALGWLNRGSVRACGKEFTRVEQATPMGLARGGLRVSRADARELRQVVHEIERRSRPGEYIYAAPDCPYVYFLSARRNPTRTFYDFFDEDYRAAPGRRAARVLTQLERHDVRLVVVNRRPEFSPFQPELQAGLLERYAPETGDDAYLILCRRPPDPPRQGREPP
jgi:Dolichyl-phosphate-mannose-protein mannosyltransferase